MASGMTDLSSFLSRPILLAADNFTPLERTPWAGDKIGKNFKSNLVSGASGKLIGESWEFSCDPAFPSRLADSDVYLGDLVKQYPVECLGARSQGEAGFCEVLVKLLNANKPLSLQVHPDDDDPVLKDHECGKPESWLVLDAEPGAGIYLGFSSPAFLS